MQTDPTPRGQMAKGRQRNQGVPLSFSLIPLMGLQWLGPVSQEGNAGKKGFDLEVKAIDLADGSLVALYQPWASTWELVRNAEISCALLQIYRSS